ncbi:TPA: polysaccharide biosynthesis family protein [Yersinia enterocolitica]|nr:polysaccharide biosynthesis family protein [Yersinia enterocolitica]HDY4931231.1 polysaccharide biosynthesis family protein [Yersinia enterocolitica]HEC1636093.1 polysaccharide biosynthesis family protein [Yersinia enterocolitica]HED0388501.1 polysaccharide biosynthesis family protein [Yersinia enterocolitica]
MMIKNKIIFLSKRIAPPICEQFCGPLALLILTPIVINKLGSNSYGSWILLISLSSFSQVVCLGITAWTTKIISESLAQNKLDMAINKVDSALSVVISIYSIILLFYYPIFFLINLYNPNFLGTFSLFVIATAFFQEIDNLFTNTVKGYELFHYSFYLEFVGRIIWFSILYAGIIYDDILLFTFLATMAKSCVKYIGACTLAMSKYVFPHFTIKEMYVRVMEAKWMFLQLVGGTSLGLFDRLVIPVMLGVNKLASYVPCIQLAQLAFSIPAAANQIFMPMFSRYKTSNNYPANWMKLVILSAILSGTPCLALFIFSKPILGIWIGETFANENYHILKVLSLAYLLLSCLSTFHFVILGVGNSRYIAKVNLVGGALMMVATLAISHLGLVFIAYVKFIYPLIQLGYIKKVFDMDKQGG